MTKQKPVPAVEDRETFWWRILYKAAKLREEVGAAVETDASSMAYVNEFMHRVRMQIKKHGGTPHSPCIPIGARGIYQGMEITVSRYTCEGLIAPVAVRIEEGFKIYAMNRDREGCIHPKDLDPALFSLP